ncbi:hypothetical protein ACOME3_002383 [Neoechinorhynchus agilis]
MAYAAARFANALLAALSGQPNVVECTMTALEKPDVAFFSEPHLLGGICNPECTVIKQLKNDQTVTILKSEKGCALVAIDTEKYTDAAHNMLDSGKFIKLNSNPTQLVCRDS